MLKEKMNVKINSVKEYIVDNRYEILVATLISSTFILGAALVKSEIGKKIL